MAFILPWYVEYEAESEDGEGVEEVLHRVEALREADGAVALHAHSDRRPHRAWSQEVTDLVNFVLNLVTKNIKNTQKSKKSIKYVVIACESDLNDWQPVWGEPGPDELVVVLRPRGDAEQREGEHQEDGVERGEHLEQVPKKGN